MIQLPYIIEIKQATCSRTLRYSIKIPYSIQLFINLVTKSYDLLIPELLQYGYKKLVKNDIFSSYLSFSIAGRHLTLEDYKYYDIKTQFLW